MHCIYLIHKFHNLSWITEINELFHDILIYWDAPVYIYIYSTNVCVCVYIYIYIYLYLVLLCIYIYIYIYILVKIWSGSKPFIKVVLKPKSVLVLGQLWLIFLSTSNVSLYILYIAINICIAHHNFEVKLYIILIKNFWVIRIIRLYCKL